MKKVILGIGAAVMVTLAAINVQISLKSEKKAKLKLTNVLALANNENLSNGENGNDPPPPGCTATANCYLGSMRPENIYGSVSCRGTTLCETGVQWVRCDGGAIAMCTK